MLNSQGKVNRKIKENYLSSLISFLFENIVNTNTFIFMDKQQIS